MINSLNQTFIPTPRYQNKNWFIIDCKTQKLGRLATIVTALLKGKMKTNYHPSIDSGDYVILINTDSILINKNSKHYIVPNPGRPGHSLKIKKAVDCTMKFTIKRAVKGMLAEPEAKRLMRRLKIYNSQDYLHQAQKPIKLDINNQDFHSLVNSSVESLRL